MDARQLLSEIEARGGVVKVKPDPSGAGTGARLNVSPRSLALDLLPDLQRFKPALIELLTAPTCAQIESARRRILPYLAQRFTDAERDELARSLACLDCGISPESEAAQ